MKDSRIIAAVATLIVALLLAGLLVVARLTVSAESWPPPKKAMELVEIEEEFVDFLDPAPVHANPARDEQRRKAQRGVADAFKASENARDNTTSHGKDKGDTGSPEGEASPLDGSGSGTVGGGWIMPRYAKVDSRETGSIILQAVINSSGKVVSVEQVGGKAPASANSALVARCKAEVMKHVFTRNDDKAPERAYARITYTFR